MVIWVLEAVYPPSCMWGLLFENVWMFCVSDSLSSKCTNKYCYIQMVHVRGVKVCVQSV